MEDSKTLFCYSEFPPRSHERICSKFMGNLGTRLQKVLPTPSRRSTISRTSKLYMKLRFLGSKTEAVLAFGLKLQPPLSVGRVH